MSVDYPLVNADIIVCWTRLESTSSRAISWIPFNASWLHCNRISTDAARLQISPWSVLFVFLKQAQVHIALHHLILLHRLQKLLDISFLFLSDLQISLLSGAGLHLEVSVDIVLFTPLFGSGRIG
jgi:hypothetical protein